MARRLKHPHRGIQHPAGILCFGVLVLAWFAARLLPEQSWEHLGPLSRLSGYAATLAMMIPYVHILRRCVLHRHLGSSNRWLNWHIGAAYLGFFFLLLHCRAHASGILPLTLLLLVWAVMLSGVVGFYGQKLLYWLLPRLVPYEYGLERLEPERSDCLERAYRMLVEGQVTDWTKIPTKTTAEDKGLAAALVELVGSEEPLTDSIARARKREPDHSGHRKEWVHSRVFLGRILHQVLGQKGLQLEGSASTAGLPGVRELRWENRKRISACYPTLLRDVPQAVAEFCDEAIDSCLDRPFSFWRWVSAGKESNRFYENRYKRALKIATEEKDKELVEGIWKLVEKRSRLDLEYRLHALGRLWLLFHGPLALALLVFLVEHIAMSLRFGGF